MAAIAMPHKQVQSLEATLQQEQATLQKWQACLLQLPRSDEAEKVGEEVARTQKQLDQAVGQDSCFRRCTTSRRRDGSIAALGDPRRRYTVASEQAKQRKPLETKLVQAENEVTAAQGKLTQLQVALALLAT